jgi:DNA-binding NarL/FixJ family response regulator
MYQQPTLEEFCQAHKLSPREKSYFAMVLNGASNPEIARKYRTTEQCVKNKMAIVFLKLKLEGGKAGKRMKAFAMLNAWVRDEKKRRVLAEMNQ